MSTDGPGSPLPGGEPLAETPWGFSSQVVALVETPEQAAATIRFFSFIRRVIVASPRRGATTAGLPAHVTPDDSNRWARNDFTDGEQAAVIVRALQAIAFEPAGRADTLLSLDVHGAYLRASFDLP